MDERLLRIYLNDGLFLGTAGRELARRSQRANEGTELGTFLDRLARDISEDVATLERLMQRLDVPRSQVKRTFAIVGERVGRLKLNGRVRSYSPLSRLWELEALALGIDGKRLLWQNLRDATDAPTRAPEIDLVALTERAERQRAEIEPFRADAARRAFASTPPAATR
ncbi:MAG: hypothetical protein KY396_02220 [Actinobacteria bacterium]|nr:hypothetical protein [Actinomycetota bacterium]